MIWDGIVDEIKERRQRNSAGVDLYNICIVDGYTPKCQQLWSFLYCPPFTCITATITAGGGESKEN